MPNRISNQSKKKIVNMDHVENQLVKITQENLRFWGVVTSSGGLNSRKFLAHPIMSLPVKWVFKVHLNVGSIADPR